MVHTVDGTDSLWYTVDGTQLMVHSRWFKVDGTTVAGTHSRRYTVDGTQLMVHSRW